jgi:LPXTG-site transpeptidase (sortase) family protein
VATQGLQIQHKPDLHWVSVLLWLILFGVIALSGWLTYRYFTTGELPPAISVRALQADPRVDETPVTKQQVDQHTVAADEPRYISIPSIGVGNTRVYSVGVTENNQLDTPKNLSDTAWYNKSAKPGEGGAVLIDGHNGGITRNGVFANLNKLKFGDRIIVERGDGEIFTYEVRENQSMPLAEVNKTGMRMMMESAEDGVEGLNLITCDGKWVPRYQQFDRRIMLRAVLIEDSKDKM